MSLLDSKDGVYVEAPSAFSKREDVKLWERLSSLAVAERTVLVKCVDFNVYTCSDCIRKHKMDHSCPVCGADVIEGDDPMEAVCRCGAVLTLCYTDIGMVVVCGVSVPIIKETEDFI